MNRNEVLIMEELLNKQCLSQLRASTITGLTAGSGMSYHTVRSMMRGLVIGGCCAVGLKKGRSETYYLTSKGIDKIKELKEEVIYEK